MLVLPDNDRPLKLIAIDPGTTTMGVAVMSWTVDNPSYNVDHAFTIKCNDRLPGYRALADLHGSRPARFQQQADELASLLFDVEPNALIAESPYLGRFASAFEALTECMMNIRFTLATYDPELPMVRVDPTSVKAMLGVPRKKMKDKEEVRRRLIKRKDLTWDVSIDSLDEHAVDAVGVGLYYFINLA